MQKLKSLLKIQFSFAFCLHFSILFNPYYYKISRHVSRMLLLQLCTCLKYYFLESYSFKCSLVQNKKWTQILELFSHAGKFYGILFMLLNLWNFFWDWLERENVPDVSYIATYMSWSSAGHFLEQEKAGLSMLLAKCCLTYNTLQLE